MKYKLGEIFEVGSGGTPSKTHPEYYGGSIPWIKTGDLKNEYLYVAEDYITEEGLNNSSAKMYTPDTVLIAMYGATIGATSILKIDACTNQACAAFKKSEKVIPEYLYYFFKSQKERFVKDGVGGAQPNISAGYLKNVEMEVPTLEEQAQILDILDKTNRIIEDRRNELKELDNLIKSRFVEMFGDPNIEFKFPTGKFKEYASNMTKGPFGSDMKKDLYVPKGEDTYKVYIQINAIQKNQNLGDHYISKEYFDQKISRFEVHPGDYIITCDGTLGKLIKLDENMMTDKYFEYIWEMYMLPLMKKEARNACLVHLPSAKVIGEVEIPVPPIELQNEFLDFVTQVDKLKFEVQKSLDETQTLMDSLMQQYFG